MFNRKTKEEAAKFENNLRRTQDGREPWYGKIEPQIDLASRVGFVLDGAYDVRAQFASAIVRRNVVAKIASDGPRVTFKTAA